MAARQLALADIPAVWLGHLTDAERRAYTLVDSRLAEDATWDAERNRRLSPTCRSSG
jgi:hypothetical protein